MEPDLWGGTFEASLISATETDAVKWVSHITLRLDQLPNSKEVREAVGVLLKEIGEGFSNLCFDEDVAKDAPTDTGMFFKNAQKE